jgi:hypothetical protein
MSQAEASDRFLTDEAVVLALRTLADGIADGEKLENIRCRVDLHTSYHAVERSVFYEVRDVLIQHRDQGTIADRIVNRHGNVPWPARMLPPGTTPGSHDSACDPRPDF